MDIGYQVFGKDINGTRHIIVAAANWQYPEGSNIYQCLTACGKEDAVCILDTVDSADFVCPKCQKVSKSDRTH